MGYHRLKACTELDLPVPHRVKDFTGRPLEEMMFVVNVNLPQKTSE
jgi:hypothetical protein